VRVIAGTLRGKVLSTIRGNAVRPTSDKIRGAIFSALSSRLGSFDGCRILDMFAGSGALSIEALSRGAEFSVLFDTSDESLELVRKNLKACGLAQHSRVVRGNAIIHLDRALAEGPYDVVFVDPPYGKNMAQQALETVATQGMLKDGAWVIAETGRNETLPETIGNLELSHKKDYGSTSIHYYNLDLVEEGP